MNSKNVFQHMTSNQQLMKILKFNCSISCMSTTQQMCSQELGDPSRHQSCTMTHCGILLPCRSERAHDQEQSATPWAHPATHCPRLGEEFKGIQRFFNVLALENAAVKLHRRSCCQILGIFLKRWRKNICTRDEARDTHLRH